MMSRITATVPALVVVLLRGALYTDLQRTCEDTPATSPEYKTRAGVRYLGHRGHSRRLSILRTLHGAFTNLTLPTSGVAEVSVRYIDPYDAERASPWTTLRLPAAGSTARKARRGR